MGDPEEYSATNIAFSNMQDTAHLREMIDELEKRIKYLESNVRKNTSILDELVRIFYLKESGKE